jgi:hypothetical protein
MSRPGANLAYSCTCTTVQCTYTPVSPTQAYLAIRKVRDDIRVLPKQGVQVQEQKVWLGLELLDDVMDLPGASARAPHVQRA